MAENISDGYHTLDELYYHRTVLFAAVVNQNPSKAWKTRRDYEGKPCEKGWFIAGIETPAGQFTYHCADKYWDMYHCKAVERVPYFDGHTSADVERVLSLEGGNFYV